MSLVCPVGEILAAIFLFVTLVRAQTCYYPGGLQSGHVACTARSGLTASACCDEDATCLRGGLCLTKGVMSRGSCTDEEWKDEACGSICTDIFPNASAPIIPCAITNTTSFACGLNTTACRNIYNTFTFSSDPSIILRPSELSALASPLISSALATASRPAAVTITASPLPDTAASSPSYTSGDMAGLGVGLMIPLLIAIALSIFLWRREVARTPRLMYPLPDNMEDPYTMKGGKSLSAYPLPASVAPGLRPPVSRTGSAASSNVGLKMGMNKSQGGQPVHMQSFAERYHLMKSATNGTLQVQRVELDASPAGNGEEFAEVELSDYKIRLPREHV